MTFITHVSLSIPAGFKTRATSLWPDARHSSQQHGARRLDSLGRALLVDQLFVGRMGADLHESCVIVGNNLVGIPLASIVPPKAFEDVLLVHCAINL